MNTSKALNLTIFTIIAAFAAQCLSSCCSDRITITEDGRAKACIVLADSAQSTLNAAALLQDFVFRASGASLETGNELCNEHNCIIIATVENGCIPEDGFSIQCDGGNICILGNGKGAVNGVVRILEDKMGVRYWAGGSVDVPQNKSISFKAFNLDDAPAFRYRQSQSWCEREDPLYKTWHSMETPNEEFIDGMWVHTFGRILPVERFGSHKDWYALVNGERRPGSNAQWCLCNDELFEAVCVQLDSIFKANPGMDMISVSQNDGSDTYCTCDKCKAIYEEEGAVSGAYVRFLNRLAERFPDKKFSTLAYLFTMNPPSKVKPLENVNIMLCDIDCKRERPLTDTEAGKWFVRALEGWSAISNNIFLWDYGINFDNMVSPFPNFHILAPNIRLFRDNNVKMHFAQVNGLLGTDFSELRAYMLAKLMWNPDADARKLEKEFMYGYYGAAGKYLLKYMDMITDALLKSGKELWIYDSPITHKDGCLNAELRKKYNELFDKAEAAVADDEVKLRRVRISRLTLQYSELEIGRTNPDADPAQLSQALDLFEARTAEYGIPTLNERNNKPGDYCRLYRERFLPGSGDNIARGASVCWPLEPTGKYAKMSPSVLTDGLFGGTTYVESWVGWEGIDGEVIVDLGESRSFNTVEADFLHQVGAWILLPKGGTYYISEDGENYTELGSFSFPEDRSGTVTFVKGTAHSDAPVQARYIKLHINTLGLCPSWHYGVGHPVWFFLDEIMVK